MRKLFMKHLQVGILGILVCLGMISCEQDLIEDVIIDEDAVTDARAIYSSRSVNWNNYSSNGTYTKSQATSDFGNVNTWNESRAYISNGTCRVTLLKNALSGSCGLIANIDVSDGTSYEMDWQVKFHSQFDWSRGGKLGFGFLIGDENTGCDRADDGNGGSLRVMWYNNDTNVYLKPYVYYKDMPSTCGNDFGKKYPTSGSLQKGTWYSVHLWAKLNTGSSTNGNVEMKVNGTTILSQSIRWVTNDSKRKVKHVSFHTFRGGSQTYWQSSSDGYIYYDNLYWNKVQ